MIDALRALYAAGIDCGVETYQGVGAIAWIVDRGNCRIERRFALEEIESISDWLYSAAIGERGDLAGSSPRDLLTEIAASSRKGPHRAIRNERERRERTG